MSNRFSFTYLLGNGAGDDVCFAELDGRATVNDDATIEIELHDVTSSVLVDAPECLRDIIDIWLRTKHSEQFHAALEDARAGRLTYDREISHAA